MIIFRIVSPGCNSSSKTDIFLYNQSGFFFHSTLCPSLVVAEGAPTAEVAPKLRMNTAYVTSRVRPAASLACVASWPLRLGVVETESVARVTEVDESPLPLRLPEQVIAARSPERKPWTGTRDGALPRHVHPCGSPRSVGAANVRADHLSAVEAR